MFFCFIIDFKLFLLIEILLLVVIYIIKLFGFVVIWILIGDVLFNFILFVSGDLEFFFNFFVFKD